MRSIIPVSFLLRLGADASPPRHGRSRPASARAIAISARSEDSCPPALGGAAERGGMKSLNIAIVDLVTNKPTRALWSRFMNPNLASIMGQAAAVWCEQLGHRVRYICFTGTQDIVREVGEDVDVVIIGAFTRSALTAYALSSFFRARGVVTILGGPHARCYPDDA